MSGWLAINPLDIVYQRNQALYGFIQERAHLPSGS
jgi:hypothetical protein